MNSALKLSLSTWVAQTIITGFVAVVGVCTPITLIAQAAGLPFRVYWVAVTAAVVLAVGLVMWASRRFWPSVEERDVANLALLAVVSLAAMLLALITSRPDADDYYYVPNARYFLQNPDAPMDFAIHQLVTEGEPVISYAQQNALASDHLRAVAAWIFHVDYLVIYYAWSSAVAAALIPIAYYFLISRFTASPREALLGAVAALGLLLVLTDTHRTFGNFAIPRIYQGKAVLLAVGLPAFAALGLSFLMGSSHRLFFWAALVAASLAMLGMSGSAIPLLAVLTVGLAAGWLWANPAGLVRPNVLRQTALRLAAFGASLGFVAAYALFLRSRVTYPFGIGSPMAAGFPTDYLGHLLFFVNPDNPRTPVAVGVCLVLAALLLRGQTGRLLAGWAAAITMAFLNPLVAPFLMDKFTTPNVYFRLFYAYPFPLVGGLILVELARRVNWHPRQAVARGAAFALLAVCIAIYVADEARVDYLAFRIEKFPARPLEVARGLVAAAPPGLMLTPVPDPLELYGVVPMVDANYPQMLIRSDLWESWLADPYDRGLRYNAALFAGGLLKYRADFERLLSKYPIRSVVIVKSVADFASVPDMLAEHQLTRSAGVGRYVVFWKP